MMNDVKACKKVNAFLCNKNEEQEKQLPKNGKYKQEFTNGVIVSRYMSEEEQQAKLADRGKGLIDRKEEPIPFVTWRKEKLKDKNSSDKKRMILQVAFTGTADLTDSARDTQFIHKPFICDDITK